MNKQITVPITYGRQNLYTIVEKVQKPGCYYNFTVNGVSKVVVMSADEFDSWVETLEVMRDFPNIAEDTLKAHKEYAKGNYITLDQLLAKSEKNSIKLPANAVHNRNSKKGTKRAR